MPRRKGQGGNPAWVKGKSANPSGRPPDALNAVMKKITKSELEDIANLIIRGDVDELRKVRASEKGTPTIRVLFASVILQMIADGDMNSFDKLLNRLIGKVKDEVNVHNSGTLPTTVVLKIPDNGRDAK